jgi:hypothetical protein
VEDDEGPDVGQIGSEGVVLGIRDVLEGDRLEKDTNAIEIGKT